MRLVSDGSYRAGPKDLVRWAMIWTGLCMGIAWLFYDQILYSVIGWAAFPIFFKKMKTYAMRKYQKKFQMEFKDMMISIYSSLSAGAALEECFYRARSDLSGSFGSSARMVLELEILCRKLERNISLGQGLEEMVQRCFDEDLDSFVQVLLIGKRQGGNPAALVQDSVEKIQKRIETGYEIEGIIGAKRNEFLFMCVVPAGVLVYMKLLSPEFMQVLYGNLPGMLIMTVCLGLYGASVYLGLYLLR